MEKYLLKNKLPKETPYMIDGEGALLFQTRKTCKQIFQRMMVTFDGKVGMCCNDWGAQYNLGYLSRSGFNSRKEEEKVIKNVKENKKGFELLKNIEMPKEYNNPQKKVSNLNEIWDSKELNSVRHTHLKMIWIA